MAKRQYHPQQKAIIFYWPLYANYMEISNTNQPPPYLKLTDWHIAKVLESKIQASYRHKYYPSDLTLRAIYERIGNLEGTRRKYS